MLLVPVLASLLAGPVYLQLVHRFGAPGEPLPDWLDFPRVWNRLLMVGAVVVGAVLMARRGLWTREVLGWSGDGPPRFAQGAACGLALGLLLLVFQVLAEVRHVAWELAPDVCARILFTALFVGLLEETLFRGVLWHEVRRRLPRGFAACVTAVIFALVHFIKAGWPEGRPVTWSSGWEVWAWMPAMWAAMPRIAAHGASLLALGLLLGIVRARDGGIARCAGWHAGLVVILQAAPRVTDYDGGPWKWAMSRQIVNGWDCLAWLVLAILVLLAARNRRPA
jgi:membrane protease YdiL (CAAX protease family)